MENIYVSISHNLVLMHLSNRKCSKNINYTEELIWIKMRSWVLRLKTEPCADWIFFFFKSNFVIEGRKVSCISAFPCSLLDTSRDKDKVGTGRKKGNSKTVSKTIALKQSLACVKCLLQNQNILDRQGGQSTNWMQGQVEPTLHYFTYWKSIKGSPEGDALGNFFYFLFLQIYGHRCLYKQIRSHNSCKTIVIFPLKYFTLVKLSFLY